MRTEGEVPVAAQNSERQEDDFDFLNEVTLYVEEYEPGRPRLQEERVTCILCGNYHHRFRYETKVFFPMASGESLPTEPGEAPLCRLPVELLPDMPVCPQCLAMDMGEIRLKLARYLRALALAATSILEELPGREIVLFNTFTPAWQWKTETETAT